MSLPSDPMLMRAECPDMWVGRLILHQREQLMAPLPSGLSKAWDGLWAPALWVQTLLRCAMGSRPGKVPSCPALGYTTAPTVV